MLIVVTGNKCNSKSLVDFGLKERNSGLHRKSKKSLKTPKQKRAYHRIKSGLKVAQLRKERLYFLTLTSSDRSPNFSDHNDSFRKLKQIVQRLTPLKLLKQGFIKPSDKRRYYNNLGWGECLQFDYFKVHTSEGNGVFHILFKGQFIPHSWLEREWVRLHNSWNVNIEKCWGDKHKVAGYVAGQYVVNQDNDNSFTRYSWSNGWLFAGAVQKWYWLKKWSCLVDNKEYGYSDVFDSIEAVINAWHLFLGRQVFPQKKLQAG